MHLTIPQKKALARVASDMVRADNIIEKGEIDFINELTKVYDMRDQIYDGRHIKFSDAVKILRELNGSGREEIFERIHRLSTSDDVCVPKEALLLMALKYGLLLSKDAPQARLISCPTNEQGINDQYIIYIESRENAKYADELNDQIAFRLMVHLAAVNGFHFIYIPAMAKEFGQMEADDVKNVIQYIAPHLKKEKVDDVYKRLCNMTTCEFVNNVLCEQLHVDDLLGTQPSLLVNIGTSAMSVYMGSNTPNYYSEFLCLPVKSSVLQTLDGFLKEYETLVTVREPLSIQNSVGQFKYFGFYKSLFDFLIASPSNEPQIIFAGRRGKRYLVCFKLSETHIGELYLTPGEYDLYYNVVMNTYNGGKGYDISPEQATMAPLISRIKRKIAEQVPELACSEQYFPTRVGNGRKYKLKVRSQQVFINKEKDGRTDNEENLVGILDWMKAERVRQSLF